MADEFIPLNVQQQANLNKNRSDEKIEEDKKKKGKVATYPDGPNGRVVYVPIGEETAKQGKPINDAIDRQITNRKETDAWLQNQYDKSPLGQSELNSADIANEKAQRIADLAKRKAFDAETIRRQEMSGYTESRADIIKGQNQEAVDQKSQDSEEDNSERGQRIRKLLGKSLSQVRDENPSFDPPTEATKYSEKDIAENRQALMDRAKIKMEQVALAEQGSRNRYRSFLADRGEDPDTIGGATLERNNNADESALVLSSSSDPELREYAFNKLRKEQSTPRGMKVPMVQDEYDAENLKNQFAGESNRLSIAANIAKNRGQGNIYATELNARDAQRAKQGKSSEARRRYWMNLVTEANATRKKLASNPYATP